MDIDNSAAPFTRTTLNDTTGLLGSTASSTSAAVFGATGASGVTTAFAGQEVTFAAAGRRIRPRSISVTTAGHTGSYKTGAGNALVVTGSYKGLPVTENVLLTTADGGEIVYGKLLYDDPTLVSIAVPGQVDALGAFSVGVADVGGIGGKALRAIKSHASGNAVVLGLDAKYSLLVLQSQTLEPVVFERLCIAGAGLSTTITGVTVYE